MELPVVLQNVASGGTVGAHGVYAFLHACQALRRGVYTSHHDHGAFESSARLHQDQGSGLAAVHVPFKGNPDIITSLIAGDIHLALMPPGVAMPHVKAGKLHAIGLAGGRSLLVPEVPPLADAGVKDLRLEVWTAVIAPAKLSAEARNRLLKAIPEVLHSEEVRQKLFNQGWQAVGSSSEGLASRVKEESALMGRIISTQGIKIE